jgi:hypothetical protein
VSLDYLVGDGDLKVVDKKNTALIGYRETATGR